MRPKVPVPIRIAVPGLKRSVGLGHILKTASTAVGIRPCGGCQSRARALDRRVAFVPGRGAR